MKKKIKPGRQRDEKLDAAVLELFNADHTQRDIANKLGYSSVSTVALILRRNGIKPKAYSETNPVHSDKRKCRVCGINKPLSEYPSPRHGVCQMCTRKNRAKKS